MADEFVPNVFVGSEIGYLKAVDLGKNSFNNVVKPSKESADHKHEEICTMCWKNSQKTQILLGLRSGIVKTYDIDQSTFTNETDCDVKDSHFTGLFCNEKSLITCTESGVIRILNDNETPVEMKVGNHISRMRHNQCNRHIVGTGGKENDLKLWDLEKSQNVFRAKNVRNDNLDLRVPVWVTDLGFLPSASAPKVVTGTGYHQVRLYDTKAKKRPVFSMDFEDCPISSICVTDQDNSFIVGNTSGTMSIIDLRKGQVVGNFKGFAGSIRCIEYCDETGRIGACGLDRFLRVYDKKSRNLLQKVYLKTKLNCLLFSSSKKEDKRQSNPEYGAEKMTENNNLRKGERLPNLCKDEVDRLWDSMEVVQTESGKRKKKPKQETIMGDKLKKKKKKA